MAGPNRIKASSSLLFAPVIILLASACGSSSTSASESARTGAFDAWYQSFLKDRNYSTCSQEIAGLDPSRDEKADWDARKRQFYVEISSDPRITTDTASSSYVPGLKDCVINANYAADRDVGRLEDVSVPPTPVTQGCTKAAFDYVTAYNSLRAKRHPTAEKQLCSGR